MRAPLILLAFLVTTPARVQADEQTIPLAVAGEWIAAAHQVSMTAAPDVCIAMHQRAGLAFRFDGESGMQMRIINNQWSLPPSVDGVIEVSVAAYSNKFKVANNTSNTVMAELEPADYSKLFDSMDKSGGMTITVGAAAPIRVSLVGSTKVLTAFKTCAGIPSGSTTPGANPFR